MNTKLLCTVSISALALTLAGCGDGGQPSAAEHGTTPAATVNGCPVSSGYPASPTKEQLDELLRRGLDPAVDAAQKVDLMQGAAADPDLFNRMGVALRQANFSVTINGVTDYCNGTANAEATLSFSGQTSNGQVPLVAEDGHWKLEKSWGCGLARNLAQSSPICE